MLWKFKRVSVWNCVGNYRSFLREIHCFKINPSPKLLTDSSVKTHGVGKCNHPRRGKIGSFIFKKWLFYLKNKWILPDILAISPFICTFQIGVFFCFKQKWSRCILFCNLLPPNFCLRIQDIRKFYIVFILWVYQSLYSPSSPPFFVAVNIFVKNTLLPRWIFVSICKGLWFSSAHLGLRSLRCACVTSPVRVYIQQNSQEMKTVKSLTESPLARAQASGWSMAAQ